MENKNKKAAIFNTDVKGNNNKITMKGNAPEVKVKVSGKDNVIKTKEDK